MKLWPLFLFIGLSYWTELASKQPQTSWSFSHDFRGDERQTVTPSEWDGWRRIGLD